MKQCSNCNYIFETTTVPAYCPKCGGDQSITEEVSKLGNKKCPKCGSLNINEANYCTDCGSDLRGLLMEG